MTTFYSIDAANDRLPEVREILERLRQQRADLIRLRDDLAARTASVAEGRSPVGIAEDGVTVDLDTVLRRAKLRMQGLVDQMQAGVIQLDAWGITLRDIETGLIDFPAIASGRQVWLCWRLGEGDVGWWHELEAGFGGRRPLIDLT